MARIRPYESQISPQADLPARNAQSSDFGGPGLSNLGEGTQILGQNLAQANRFLMEQQARQEVTDASVALTQLGTELVIEHDEAAKRWKPGDPPLSETFSGVVTARLEKLRGAENGEERFTTQQGLSTFQTHAAQLVSHFTGLTLRTDAHLAGEAAKEQHRALVDGMGNFLQGHPAYFSLRRDELDAVINDPNGVYGRLSAVQRSELVRLGSEQLAISAVQGFIRKTPNVALETLNDPMLKQDEQYGWIAQYIPNEKMQVLLNNARTMVDAQEAEARRVQADLRRQETEMHHATGQSLTAKLLLHEDNPGNPQFPPLTATEVGIAMLENRLDSGTGRALHSMMKAAATEHAPKTDYGAMWDMFKRVTLPETDPRKLRDLDPINQLAIQGRLEPQHFKFLRDEFVNARTDEGGKLSDARKAFLDMWKPSIDTSIMGQKLDQSGALRFGEFVMFAKREEERMRKEGKNPHDLYDDQSQDYLGRKTRPYIKTMMEQIKDFGETLKQQQGLPKTGEDIQVPNPDASTFGKRPDGTAKGSGFFGVLKRPDGKVSSELSTDDPIDNSGKKVLHPLIVPSLTRPELDYLLSGQKGNQDMEQRIYKKSADHARERIKAGKSPFAGPGEQQSPPSQTGGVPKALQRMPGETPQQYLDRMKKP